MQQNSSILFTVILFFMDQRQECHIYVGTPFTKWKVYNRKVLVCQVPIVFYLLEFLAHFQYSINICWIDESEDKLFI